MARIITSSCPHCGTIIAGNVLEQRREMKCPGLGCDHVRRFAELSVDAREHLLEHRADYQLEQ